MPIINPDLHIPATELSFTYVRSSGPGGQNVNKVASKAVLRWDLAASTTLPADVKARLRTQQHRRITTDGELVLSSQRYRDQERNRQDCLAKLAEMIQLAAVRPKLRKATKPSRGAKERRLQAKRRRADRKTMRRSSHED
jgi:ribosome-associated protein